MKISYSKLAWAFGLLIALIIYDANSGGSFGTLYVMNLGAHADKFAHFIVFGLLSFILNMAVRLKCARISGHSVYLGTLLVSLFALVEELSQLFIQARTFDFKDLLADFAGLSVFALFTYLVAKHQTGRSIH